ncbi:calcitonin-like receptor [Plakobranchus ocellatus]|uniref:Calcitonin-like receptor n=1 Tax=Plakobranchus ocellatus TaxID=259542 RepID=A0AAV3YBQ4_9GAST|nr:calcitonin-like receptor [Plakobranchus ocellatus]
MRPVNIAWFRKDQMPGITKKGMCHLFQQILLAGFASADQILPSERDSSRQLCRDRADFFLPHHFRVSTCSMCLIYLFPTIPEFKIRVLNGVALLLKIEERKLGNTSRTKRVGNPVTLAASTRKTANDSLFHPQGTSKPPQSGLWSVTLVSPDVEDEASLLPVSQCLPESKKLRWLQCCGDAQRCCQRQIEKMGQPKSISNEIFASSTQMDRTPAQASKRCMSNGSWWVSTESQMEWTDYSSCVDMDMKTPAYSTTYPTARVFVCHPACLIGDCSSVGAPCHDGYVANTTTGPLRQHRTGFHLHWLMVRTFKPINSISVYIFVGWGIPTCLVLIYLCLRLKLYNTDSCWLMTIGGLEWLIDAPTIACIALNVIFLILILRALLFQLKSQPDDVGSLRRTMKALLLLVPLLGLQQFCILYRPKVDQAGYFVYAVVSAIIVNLQVQASVSESFRKIRRKFPSAQSDLLGTNTALSLISMSPRLSLVPIFPTNQERTSIQQSGLGVGQTESSEHHACRAVAEEQHVPCEQISNENSQSHGQKMTNSLLVVEKRRDSVKQREHNNDENETILKASALLMKSQEKKERNVECPPTGFKSEADDSVK